MKNIKNQSVCLSSKSCVHHHSSDESQLVSNNYITLITIIVVLISIFKLYDKFFNKRWKKIKGAGKKVSAEKFLGIDDLPAEKPWIPWKLIGNVPQLFPLSNALRVGIEWINRHGDVFTITALNQTIVILNSGPSVQALMKSSDIGHVTKLPIFYDQMKPFITNGVLVSKGAFWQKQRKILQKSQRYQNLKNYMEMLNRYSKNLVQNLEVLYQDEKPHQINGLISVTFLGVIYEMITGRNVDSKKLERYHHNFSIWTEVLIKKILNPLLIIKPIWMLHPLYKKYENAVQEMIDFAKAALKDEISNTNKEDKSIKDNASVLEELVIAGVEEIQIVEEFNTMMFGGHETGAGAIHFLCFALALNPEIQECARKEVDELFTDPSNFKNDQITFEAVQTLKYVERCILETLRLFPSVFLIGRQLETPLQFDYKDKTVLLPSGTNAIVSAYGLHRLEKYFPNPEIFDPDRFLPENIASRHPYSYIPFSGGPRNCMGQKFAMIEMKILTAWILRHFELTTTDKMEDIPILPYTTLTPERDYNFVFKRRNI